MATKIKVTRTINPLHFEDLEPHRFEDLVRRLLYAHRDWISIEATGRSGSDEGFDIRAWEKGESVTNLGEEGDEGEHVIDGRLWQVQGKREKSITPAKMRILIRQGVNHTNPPYGYILAAATNISKKTYDVFREELTNKGVVEFSFWSKDHLEDQLSLPQNDEILFTFFGLSLSPRRRSRIAELKFNINNKNKLLKLIFGREEYLNQGVPRHKAFLLRDINADRYPSREAYPDFDKRRRWEEHDAVHVTATGVYFKVRERYAYLDLISKKLAVLMTVDLTPRAHNIDDANQARLEELGRRAEHFWRHLPRRNQAKLHVYGFLKFDRILIIDEKGDPEFKDPHLFIDFDSAGPFQHLSRAFKQDDTELGDLDIEDFEEIEVFPPTFPEAKTGKIYDVDQLGLDPDTRRNLEYMAGIKTLFSFGGKLDILSEGSLVRIPSKGPNEAEKYAEITHIYQTNVAAFTKGLDSEFWRSRLCVSAGREVKDAEGFSVYELHEVTLIGERVSYRSDRY